MANVVAQWLGPLFVVLVTIVFVLMAGAALWVDSFESGRYSKRQRVVATTLAAAFVAAFTFVVLKT
jgi:hypothetical protein